MEHLPSDFLVREVLVARTCLASMADYTYLSLSKSGFTTMEAVRIIAEAFDVPSTAITYGGLKDEDGITEQLVALPRAAATKRTWEHVQGDDRYLRLAHHGFGAEPLTIAGLEGNAFRIVVRNVDEQVAQRLCDRRKLNFSFLNYYDIQRFGVPGGVRRTHHVGAALLDGKWDEALAELAGLSAPESGPAGEWTGEAAEFFRTMDPRVPSFYLSAHGSAEWNARLRALVHEVSPGEARDHEVEGVGFTYVPTAAQAHRTLAASADLPYRRYTFGEDGITHQESTRPTVIQTQMACRLWGPDEFHPGRVAVELRFFLPSGCYATAAVRQLFGRGDVTEPC